MNKKNVKNLALIILDGWGLGENADHNAIFKANPKFFNSLWKNKNISKTTLKASEKWVGLPEGQIGGSEVGHLTIGSGKIIDTDLVRINKFFKNYSESKNKNFQKFLELSRKHHTHLIGLVSDGGVHSHIDHLFSILEIMKNENCKNPFIHFISDGRDTSPTSGVHFAKKLETKIKNLKFGKIATLCGRYFAMDRDKNLDRTKLYVQLFLNNDSVKKESVKKDSMNKDSVDKDSMNKESVNKESMNNDSVDKDSVNNDSMNKESVNKESMDKGACPLVHPYAFQEFYKKNITDEFIPPTSFIKNFSIQKNEPIFFFNFRADRMKQIVSDFHENFSQNQIFTMTEYDENFNYFSNLHTVFEKEKKEKNFKTLGQIISENNLVQVRLAESEKQAHVSYFFNGGKQEAFSNEIRIIEPSNKTTHDHFPEMKAKEISENLFKIVREKNPNFILMNFANPDMVGHTGNFSATVKAVQKVDETLEEVCKFLDEKNYIVVITADHGNADMMYDPKTFEPHTAHTLASVPFIVMNKKIKLSQNDNIGLSEIASIILRLMNISS